MKDYTVVGLWMDADPPCRVAAWVEAESPEEAIRLAASGIGSDDGDLGDLLVAGVFEGHLYAVDEQ